MMGLAGSTSPLIPPKDGEAVVRFLRSLGSPKGGGVADTWKGGDLPWIHQQNGEQKNAGPRKKWPKIEWVSEVYRPY